MKQPKLIESIRLENGKYSNLSYHEERMRRACTALRIDYRSLPLSKFLSHVSQPTKGLWKCRIVYSDAIHKVEFKPYTVRPIASLKLVYDDTIVYNQKYEERSHLDKLYAQRQDCDDIIIVKDNMLTDSYYGNLVLWKEGKWYTPDSCLLAGTQRACLIDSKAIQVVPISVDDFKSFEKVKIINAMMNLEDGPEVLIGEVLFD